MNSSLRAASYAVCLVASTVLAIVARAADARVYIQYNPGQKAAVAAALAQQNARTHHEFDNLNAIAATIPGQARAGLERNPNIAFIEEDPRRDFLAESIPYGVTMVDAATAVKAGATGAGIKVGVVDSGVHPTHEDLVDVAITGEPDFGASDQRTWYRDVNSHGTHVTGTLAAMDNNLGVIGVSPGAVSIHMVKVFGDAGQWVYSSDVVAAARVAVAKGARVINMSLGGSRRSRTEEAGMNDLYVNKGALLVAAAGNGGTTAYSYPASYNSVVSVAAIDASKAVAAFSQQNDQVELAAPGVAVPSTVSYIDQTSVTVGRDSYSANHIEFSARGTVTAPLVYGGLGTATDAAWAGRVVLVDRGSISFNQKVQNVQASGGVACVIANNVAGNFLGTLGDGNSSTIPAVSVSQADGTALKGQVGSDATVSTLLIQPANGYAEFDGTSMATPHVAGVAALIWSQFRGATATQVRQALVSSAEDLAPAGRDPATGYGLVQAGAALSALGALNPAPAPADRTAPVISNRSDAVVNSRQGTFQISWTTDEPATSDVQINTTVSEDSTLATTHSRTFRGTRGATYYYFIISRDAAGNVASAGPYTISL